MMILLELIFTSQNERYIKLKEWNVDMTEELDARGLFCPEPVFKTGVKLKEIDVGETLVVKTDDPSSKGDMEIYCNKQGYEIENIEESEDGEYTFTIHKSK